MQRHYVLTAGETRTMGKLTKIAAGASTLLCAVAGLQYYFGGQNLELIELSNEMIEMGLAGYFITGTLGLTYLQGRSDNKKYPNS